ncbi:hypothetical protein GCM10023187_24740 [Nibrella viscosa]|uniref:DUF4834 domain-containing protein n=1 Tax=Nibrella viscosa TaxID=1084524 RepID=A0ABP8KGK0_9BACT
MLIKYLFIAFLIIVFVPPVRRFVFYLLVGRQLVKEQKKQTSRSAPGKEGKIRVDHVPPNANESKIQGGDYVDYEEVK